METKTLTLTEFLLARIGEDEATVRAVIEDAVPRSDGSLDLSVADFTDQALADYNPARVLAECEAKRQIVELADEATGLDMQVDGEFRVGSRDEAAEPYCGDLILRALALPYADHPDYSEEWKP